MDMRRYERYVRWIESLKKPETRTYDEIKESMFRRDKDGSLRVRPGPKNSEEIKVVKREIALSKANKRYKTRHSDGDRTVSELVAESKPKYDLFRKHYSREVTGRMRAIVKMYGLFPVEFMDMVVRQGGGCGICGVVMLDPFNLEVDHCHKTGKIRGLLCRPCNIMLGWAKDSILNLQNAVIYLECSEGR